MATVVFVVFPWVFIIFTAVSDSFRLYCCNLFMLCDALLLFNSF